MSRLIITEKGIKYKKESAKRRALLELYDSSEFKKCVLNKMEKAISQEHISDLVLPARFEAEARDQVNFALRQVERELEDYEVVDTKRKKGIVNVNDVVYYESDFGPFVMVLTDHGYSNYRSHAIPFGLGTVDLADYPNFEDNMYGKKVGDSFKLRGGNCVITKILSPKQIQDLMYEPDENKKDPTKLEYGDIVFLKNLNIKKGTPILDWTNRQLFYTIAFDNDFNKDFDNMLSVLIDQEHAPIDLRYKDLNDYFEGKCVGDVMPISTYSKSDLCGEKESQIVGTMSFKTFKKRFLP